MTPRDQIPPPSSVTNFLAGFSQGFRTCDLLQYRVLPECIVRRVPTAAPDKRYRVRGKPPYVFPALRRVIVSVAKVLLDCALLSPPTLALCGKGAASRSCMPFSRIHYLIPKYLIQFSAVLLARSASLVSNPHSLQRTCLASSWDIPSTFITEPMNGAANRQAFIQQSNCS